MSVNLPTPSFPNALDDDSTLLRVYNIAESILSEDMEVTDDVVSLTPDFDVPEKWSSDGGFIKIGDEDAFYSKTERIYAPSDDLATTGGIFISQFDVANLGSPMMINGLSPEKDSGGTSVTIRGQKFTCAGIIRVGNKDVEFAVQGNGPHGAGATFYVSRPDLVQLQFCSIDADAGKIMVSTISFGWFIQKLFWIVPQIDDDGTPLRRINKLYSMTRGLHGTQCSRHEQGEFVRGNIMAEHHAIMSQVILAMEGLVGVDESAVRSTQDFRLRDLSDLCVEEDDYGCPDPVLDVVETTPPNPEGQVCLTTRTFDLEATIGGGGYDRFAIFFGDGTSTSDSLSASHRYPVGSRVEPYIYAANANCEASSGFFEDSITTIEGVPEIPNLVCPDIIIPNIPAIPDVALPDFEPSNTQIIINGPTANFSIPDIFVSIPNSIYLSASLPDISIFVPSFPTSITVIFDPPPITIVYTISIDFPPDVGPCFQLIPCNTGYHHPGYH